MAGRLLRFLLIAIIGIVAVSAYPQILHKSSDLEQQQANPDSGVIDGQKEQFLQSLYRGNYSLYWDLNQNSGNPTLRPSDIFLPKPLFSNENRSEYIEEFTARFNAVMDFWQHDFFRNAPKSYGLEYLAIDNRTGKKSTNSLQRSLVELAEQPQESSQFNDTYAFYAFIVYQPDGTMSIPVWHGLDESKKNALMLMELNNTLFAEERGAERQYIAQIAPPKSFTIVYAAKAEQFYVDQSKAPFMQSGNFNDAGFLAVYWLSIGCVMLMALLLFRFSWYATGNVAAKIPLEGWILGMLGTALLYDHFLEWSNEIARGNYFKTGGAVSSLLIWTKEITWNLVPLSESVLSHFFNVAAWMLILYIWHLGALSVLQIANVGVRRYFREFMLLGKWSRRIKHMVRSNILAVKRLNLSDPYTKHIAKILAVHFAIITAISFMWLFGIILLIPYALFVFYVLRRYLNKIRSNYAILFNATRQMAEKNLEISIDEDLGLFNPLKEELQKIMDGFKRAVDEEIKSQKTKSDLITNVSHDLKTPVTAIITYVGLLQNEQISNEEKRAYIDILNAKSQRLQRLIDDLFEFTRTASGNVNLNLVDVDLMELIRQVQVELSDSIADSRVQFRLQQPEDKAVVPLDSEKTYRIFENLFTNVIKYSPPDSRAYIEVQNKDGRVTVIVKNVSSFELNFTPEEIMERFVRGDTSRHTEGSGLGLAIVKNLVELQGGSFRIELDGDLFKAIIQWETQPV
jgi:signal transduction histidine kinase